MVSPNGKMPINDGMSSAQTPSSVSRIDQNDSSVARDQVANGPFLQKLENDIQPQGKKLLQHEENIKYLKNVTNSLDQVLVEMQVTLGKHHSSSKRMAKGNDSLSHIRSLEETVDHILQYEKSAAGLMFELTRHSNQAAQISSMEEVVGVVSTLGHVVDDINLSRLLSEYLGLDTMLALVCRTYDGVKTMETYDKEGVVNRRTGLYGLGASIGRVLDGRFNVICLEDLIPYAGEFMPDDPQRRLALLKPKLPNGESPAGFLGFAVNMIYIDSEYLSFVTTNGHGLRETLFYSLFSQLQVYRTRTDMLKALPCISNGAISLDGGMIRGRGVFTLGTRKEMDVIFPICSGDSFQSEDYIEIENQMRELKWKKDRMMEDIQREERLLAHAKHNFEVKNEELIRFMAQRSLDPMYLAGEKNISKDVGNDAEKKRKHIIKNDEKDVNKKRKGRSVKVISGADNTDLKRIQSSPDSDFVIPAPKKSKKVKRSMKAGKLKVVVRKDERRGKKQAEKNDIVSYNETQATMKYNTIRTRTSPKTLFIAIQSLTKAQRQSVKEMGFGKLLDLKVDGITSKLGFYVVDRFDERKMEIRLNDGSIKITKDSIHDMLGVPNGGMQLQSLNSIDTEDTITGEWKKQYGKNLIRPNDVMRQLINSKDAGWNFKLNFLILFSNTMAKCVLTGSCNLSILLYIRKDTVIQDIDWCGYIWDCLKVSKCGWKRDSPISYYTGPLTLLTLLYLDTIVCNKVPVLRQRPAIKCWNMELMRQREFAEIGEGGFGLGDFQDPFEPTYAEDEGILAIEEGSVSERQQKEVCYDPSSPADIEGYLLKLDATFLEFESALKDAMSKFPGVVNLKEWSTRFESLFGSMFDGKEIQSGCTHKGREPNEERL